MSDNEAFPLYINTHMEENGSESETLFEQSSYNHGLLLSACFVIAVEIFQLHLFGCDFHFTSHFMEGSDLRPIIIDIGSAGIKAGFAGESAPLGAELAIRGIVPEKCGPGREDYFGSKITPDLQLRLKYGYLAGKCVDRDIVERALTNAVYNLCKVDPSEGNPVLVSESLGTSDKDRKWMVQCMFENVGAEQLAIVPQPTLALFETGRRSGFVLESGYGTTQFAAIKDGKVLPVSSVIALGGVDVTSSLESLLEKRFYHRTTLKGGYLVDRTLDDIKIKGAYVAQDFEKEPEKTIEVTDSDGKSVTFGKERFQCAEILFNPKLAGKDFEGIDKIACDTISKCDSNMRWDIWSNFIVSGGNTMLSGFCERLEASLRSIGGAPDSMRVIRHEDRSNAVWRGGAAFALSPLYSEIAASRDFYNENGIEKTANRFV